MMPFVRREKWEGRTNHLRSDNRFVAFLPAQDGTSDWANESEHERDVPLEEKGRRLVKYLRPYVTVPEFCQ